MDAFARKPTLTGEKVLLRGFTHDDVQPLAGIFTDPELLLHTGSIGAVFDLEDLYQVYAARQTAPDRLDLAVVDRASGELAGEVVLNEWDERSRGCNFRIALGPRGRDRGLGSEATRLILGYGFEVAGLHRISLYVYDFNPRARRVYEKVGFRSEGTEREVLWHQGAWVDATRMAILDHEWFAADC
jgi:RimJ/RimL family protein N-acetyltransferase